MPRRPPAVPPPHEIRPERAVGYVTFRASRGRWVARLPRPGAEPDGASYIQRTLGAHVRTEAQAERALAQFASEMGALPSHDLAGATLADFLADWLDEMPRDAAPKTRYNRTRAVEGHIVPALGNVRLVALTTRQVERWLNGMALAPRTVSGIRAILVQALNDAVRWGALAVNPAHLARGPRVRRVKRTQLTADEAKALLKAAAGERLEALLVCAVCLGLRRGELLGLRWADVDLTAGLLRVRVQRVYVIGAGMVERPAKAESERDLPLPALVATALRWHADRQRQERRVVGWEDHGLVFANTFGRPHWTDYTADMMARVLKRAGLPPMRLHDLRGGAATRLLELGVELPVVMELLGHRTASMTLENYSQATTAGRQRAARVVDEALGEG